MHGDLSRIKSAHSHGAKGAARTQPGNQPGARAVHKVRVTQTADEGSVVGAVIFGMVQQIRGLSGNLQLESLGEGKCSPQREVHVETVGRAKVSAGLCSVSIPVLIGDNTSVRSRDRLAGERAGVVSEEGVPLRRDSLSARQGHRRASVIPVLQGLWHLHRLAWNSVYAASDGSVVLHGNNKRYATLDDDH